MFYAAEHFLTADQGKLKNLMEETVDAFNRGYHDDILTGLFLYYENHFIHMIEVTGIQTKNYQQESTLNIVYIPIFYVYHHIIVFFF